MSRPRRGLVIGGGGVLGAAWAVGALAALEDTLGIDARDVDELVGTSAGSVLVTLLAAGVSVADLRTHQLEGRVDTGPLAGFHWDYDSATGGDRPPTPRAGLGSPVLLRKGIRELRQLPPTAVLAAFLPEGRGRLDSVGAMVRHVVPQGWPGREGLAVVAFDYDAGVRVAFGREGAPVAEAADAVMASCAIPGWYEPVRIGERRFIDGGTWSSTNLDLLVGRGLDEVYCLAPQVSFDADAPSALVSRLERQWRTRVTARALKEVAVLHADGAEVTMIGPGHEDLQAMGGNLMDVGRRPVVLQTSLRTSLAALADPAELPEPRSDSLWPPPPPRSPVHPCRVYLPLGPTGVRTLYSEKGIRVADGFAVTTALERAHPGEDEEGLEYLALQDALAAALAAREKPSALVVVAAADVPSDRLDLRAPVTAPPLSRLALRDAVPLAKVVALHVEEPPAGATEEPDLLWYDATELPEVVRVTSGGR